MNCPFMPSVNYAGLRPTPLLMPSTNNVLYSLFLSTCSTVPPACNITSQNSRRVASRACASEIGQSSVSAADMLPECGDRDFYDVSTGQTSVSTYRAVGRTDVCINLQDRRRVASRACASDVGQSLGLAADMLPECGDRDFYDLSTVQTAVSTYRTVGGWQPAPAPQKTDVCINLQGSRKVASCACASEVGQSSGSAADMLPECGDRDFYDVSTGQTTDVCINLQGSRKVASCACASEVGQSSGSAADMLPECGDRDFYDVSTGQTSVSTYRTKGGWQAAPAPQNVGTEISTMYLQDRRLYQPTGQKEGGKPRLRPRSRSKFGLRRCGVIKQLCGCASFAWGGAVRGGRRG
ncbi:hypothetical protein J6590_006199 [Homalodisca vitripennis]|nr:hypothetical protein J6590_006199 [Homalodisca vitripennis]